MTGLAHADREKLLAELRRVILKPGDRVSSLRAVAGTLRQFGPYRWVGLYDVDHSNGLVSIIVWSGPGAPEYPTFPISKGLTGAAISSGKTINVGNVAADPRYLTAFGSTCSEIVVPVFDTTGEKVAGTIDLESEQPNAFDSETQSLLEACAGIIRPLWHS